MNKYLGVRSQESVEKINTRSQGQESGEVINKYSGVGLNDYY